MKPALSSLLILALLQVPASGLRIAGRVIDGETGKPVVDAVVTLNSANADGFSKTFTVGADGLFEFVNIPRGSYQLRTQHPKPVVPYRSESLDIDLKNDLQGLGMILSPAVSKVPVKGKIVMSGGEPLPRTVSSILFSGDAVSIGSDGSFETRLRPGQTYDIGFPSAAAGAYVAFVSGAGSWINLTGTWTFREGSGSPIEIVIGMGRETITGRVTDASSKVVAGAVVSLTGPAPLVKPREVTLTSSGAFTLTGMRAGDYELRAKAGAGESMLAAFRKFSVAPQARTNLDVVLKPATEVTGRVVVLSPHTLSDLLKFDPSVQIIDVLGNRAIRIDSKGAFQFRSFDGDYTVVLTELPLEFRVDSISKDAAAVEIRIGGVQNERPERAQPPTLTR